MNERRYLNATWPTGKTAPASLLIALILLIATSGLFPGLAKEFVKVVSATTSDLPSPKGPASLEIPAEWLNAVKFHDSNHPSELLFSSIVKIDIPQSVFTGNFETLLSEVNQKKGFHLVFFSDKANLEDLSEFSLTEEDVNSLQRSRPRASKIKLSLAMMNQFQSVFSSAGQNWKAIANRTYKELIIQYLNNYQRNGASALITYADQKKPLSLTSENAEMYQASYRDQKLPGFLKTSFTLSKKPESAVETRYFWKNEQFGHSKKVFTLNQLSAFSSPKGQVNHIVIKQLYANHYFESCQESYQIIENGLSDESSFYLLYTSRVRIDMLRNGGILKGLIKRKLKHGIVKHLSQMLTAFSEEAVKYHHPE